MVRTKDMPTYYVSWESEWVTRCVLRELTNPLVSIYPQAIPGNSEYGRVTLVTSNLLDHKIVGACAIYPESIVSENCPGVQIVREELDLADLRKGTGVKTVVAGPVWLDEDGLYKEAEESK